MSSSLYTSYMYAKYVVVQQALYIHVYDLMLRQHFKTYCIELFLDLLHTHCAMQ